MPANFGSVPQARKGPLPQKARLLASFDAIISAMRTTVALDDDLVRIAEEFTGVTEKTALLREALKALIERESARRLASLAGTMPKLTNVPRRRPRPACRSVHASVDK
jgi:Arc/MetJ family transcription regulator